MAKTNYNQISRPIPNKPVHEDKTSKETATKEPIIDKAEITTGVTLGYVSNCKHLRVREKPSKDADVIGVIEEQTFVDVNKRLSTDDFYSVKVNLHGGEWLIGYCLKDYITVEE